MSESETKVKAYPKTGCPPSAALLSKSASKRFPRTPSKVQGLGVLRGFHEINLVYRLLVLPDYRVYSG